MDNKHGVALTLAILYACGYLISASIMSGWEYAYQRARIEQYKAIPHNYRQEAGRAIAVSFTFASLWPATLPLFYLGTGFVEHGWISPMNWDSGYDKMLKER